MTVCHLSSSGVVSQFIGTTGTTGGSGDNGSGGITSFSTFLFRTFGTSIQMTSGDLDLFHKL